MSLGTEDVEGTTVTTSTERTAASTKTTDVEISSGTVDRADSSGESIVREEMEKNGHVHLL